MLLPTERVVVLICLLTLLSPPPGSGKSLGDAQVKTEVKLAFYVKKGEGAEVGLSGGRYGEGDRIQFRYTSGTNRYLFLVSLEANGAVNNFNYRASEKSVPIVPGHHRLLEGSIILDDSPVPEKVFGIFSDEPLTWSQVEKAARAGFETCRTTREGIKGLQRLPLPYPQATILLNKLKT